MNKRVLCFGGGSGMPKTVLEPLKDEDDVEITSVTSMVDNGGSTGALRKEFDVLPPGDIRRHILALSQAEEWKKKLWNFRFARDIVFDGGHRGHNFANIFIAGLEYLLGDFEKALEILHEFLKVKGKCYPATLEKVQLYAELENGQVIMGEDEIDVPKMHDGSLRIKNVWLSPKAKAYGKVIEAIENVDYIIIGPGDLFSSLVPCFLPSGIKEALESSKAEKIFIAPAMTKFGETNGFYLEDFVDVLERYAGKIDYVVYNTKIPDENRLREFKMEENLLLEMVVPKDSEVNRSEKYIGVDLIGEKGPIIYDSKKLKTVLLKIIRKE